MKLDALTWSKLDHNFKYLMLTFTALTVITMWCEEKIMRMWRLLKITSSCHIPTKSINSINLNWTHSLAAENFCRDSPPFQRKGDLESVNIFSVLNFSVGESCCLGRTCAPLSPPLHHCVFTWELLLLPPRKTVRIINKPVFSCNVIMYGWYSIMTEAKVM